MDLDLEFIDESPVGGEMPECSMVPRALPDGATFPRRTLSAHRGFTADRPIHLRALEQPVTLDTWAPLATLFSGNGRVALPFGTVCGAPCGSPFPGSVSE